jgi:hypothetical protein
MAAPTSAHDSSPTGALRRLAPILAGALLLAGCGESGNQGSAGGAGGELPVAGAGGIGVEDAGVDAETDASGPDASAGFSFVVFTDVHIGEGHDVYDGSEDEVTAAARAAVERVNALASSEDVAFAFILGDITSSAQPAQLAKAREIFDDIAVPWYPLLGNHDVWTYDGSSEAAVPDGDALFSATFGDRFDGIEYPDTTVWDPEYECDVRYQSFELRHAGVVFLAPDWNTRTHAITTEPGAEPGADLHDVVGGTLPWLRDRLAELPADTRKVLFLQHHGFAAMPPAPDWRFTFSSAEKATFRDTLASYPPLDRYWGVLAGHFHRRFSGQAFDEWTDFLQVETDSCKESSDVTLVRVGADDTIEVVFEP